MCQLIFLLRHESYGPGSNKDCGGIERIRDDIRFRFLLPSPEMVRSFSILPGAIAEEDKRRLGSGRKDTGWMGVNPG